MVQIEGKNWNTEIATPGQDKLKYKDRTEFYKKRVKLKLGANFNDVINNLTTNGYKTLNEHNGKSLDHEITSGNTLFKILRQFYHDKFGLTLGKDGPAEKEAYLSLAHVMKETPNAGNVDMLQIGGKVKILNGRLTIIAADGSVKMNAAYMRPPSSATSTKKADRPKDPFSPVSTDTDDEPTATKASPTATTGSTRKKTEAKPKPKSTPPKTTKPAPAAPRPSGPPPFSPDVPGVRPHPTIPAPPEVPLDPRAGSGASPTNTPSPLPPAKPGDTPSTDVPWDSGRAEPLPTPPNSRPGTSVPNPARSAEAPGDTDTDARPPADAPPAPTEAPPADDTRSGGDSREDGRSGSGPDGAPPATADVPPSDPPTDAGESAPPTERGPGESPDTARTDGTTDRPDPTSAPPAPAGTTPSSTPDGPPKSAPPATAETRPTPDSTEHPPTDPTVGETAASGHEVIKGKKLDRLNKKLSQRPYQIQVTSIVMDKDGKSGDIYMQGTLPESDSNFEFKVPFPNKNSKQILKFLIENPKFADKPAERAAQKAALEKTPQEVLAQLDEKIAAAQENFIDQSAERVGLPLYNPAKPDQASIKIEFEPTQVNTQNGQSIATLKLRVSTFNTVMPMDKRPITFVASPIKVQPTLTGKEAETELNKTAEHLALLTIPGSNTTYTKAFNKTLNVFQKLPSSVDTPTPVKPPPAPVVPTIETKDAKTAPEAAVPVPPKAAETRRIKDLEVELDAKKDEIQKQLEKTAWDLFGMRLADTSINNGIEIKVSDTEFKVTIRNGSTTEKLIIPYAPDITVPRGTPEVDHQDLAIKEDELLNEIQKNQVITEKVKAFERSPQVKQTIADLSNLYTVNEHTGSLIKDQSHDAYKAQAGGMAEALDGQIKADETYKPHGELAIAIRGSKKPADAQAQIDALPDASAADKMWKELLQLELDVINTYGLTELQKIERRYVLLKSKTLPPQSNNMQFKSTKDTVKSMLDKKIDTATQMARIDLSGGYSMEEITKFMKPPNKDTLRAELWKAIHGENPNDVKKQEAINMLMKAFGGTVEVNPIINNNPDPVSRELKTRKGFINGRFNGTPFKFNQTENTIAIGQKTVANVSYTYGLNRYEKLVIHMQLERIDPADSSIEEQWKKLEDKAEDINTI